LDIIKQNKREKYFLLFLFLFQTAAKKRKEKEKVHIIIDKLNEELLKQKEHVERVRARLETESGNWFKNRTLTRSLCFLKSIFFIFR
jgi:hypothetical protein